MLGLILVIIAGLLTILDMVLRHPNYRSGAPYWLLDVALLLVIVALLVGVKVIPLN
jgi:hypothetical protein